MVDVVILPRHGGVGVVSQYKPQGEHGFYICIQCERHPRLENMPWMIFVDTFLLHATDSCGWM